MIERAVFEYLINSVWQVPLLACATWLLLRAARPGLRAQHALWFAALALAVLSPLRGIELNGTPRAEAAAVSAPASYTVPSNFISPQAEPTPFAAKRSALLDLHIHPLQLRDRTIDWLVGLYGVSVAFSFARLLHSYVATRRLLAQAKEQPLTLLESSLLSACAQRLQLVSDRLPTIRFLPGAASPMIIGIRHPVLLLPEDLRHGGELFNDRMLTAILWHELAHVRRRDYLANLIARIVALPIAYHPATISLERRIRQTREMICDAHAADAFASSSTYARTLLALAQRLLPQPTHVEAVGLFANARPLLEERIMKLTEPRLSISRTLRTVRVTAGAIVLVAATATAATLHLKPAAPELYAAQAMQAEQQPQAAAPAPTPAPTPQPEPTPHSRPTAHDRSHVVVDQQQRDLTPEEQARLDKDLATMRQEIQAATAQFSNGEFQAKLKENLKSINSPEFKKQMADMQKQMQQFNTPEFQQRMAEIGRLSAQSAVNSEQLRLQMADMKIQVDNAVKVHIDTDQINRQVAEAQRDALKTSAETQAASQEVRQELAEATKALAEARKQVHDADTQRHLDEAQRRIDAAGKKF